MKRSNLMFLVIGVSIIFFGCSKDDSLAPELDQSDQVTNSLKSAKTPFIEFSGVSTPVLQLFDPGTSTVLPNGKIKVTGMVADWYDDAGDVNYTGQSIWYENWLFEADGSSAKIWGKADLNLDIGGTWKISWHGTITAEEGYTLFDPSHPFTAVAYAVGTGKTGAVKGMVAHSTYTFDFDGSPETFFWSFTGSYH